MTLLALVLILTGATNNVLGSLTVDVIVVLLAWWVDSRALRTWRRLSAPDRG